MSSTSTGPAGGPTRTRPPPRRRLGGPLRGAQFRRLLLISIIFGIGLWVFQTALAWSILEETGSAAATSGLFVAWFVPVPLAALAVGPAIDRRGPKAVVTTGLLGLTVAAGAAAAVSASGAMPLALAYACMLAFGACDGAATVAAQVMTGRVVTSNHIGRAAGLTLIPVGTGRIVGGPIAGLTIDHLGVQAALFTGVGILAGAGCLTLTLCSTDGLDPARSTSLSQVFTAAGRTARQPIVAGVVALSGILGLFSLGYISLIPAIAERQLAAGPNGTGVLTAAGGAGTLVGGLIAAPIARRLGLGRAAVIAMLAGSLGLVALSHPTTLEPALGAIAMIGGATALAMAHLYHLLHISSHPRSRGQTFAVNGFVMYGTYTIGILLGGVLVDTASTVATLRWAGLLNAASTAIVVAAAPRLLDVDVDPSGAIVDHRKE